MAIYYVCRHCGLPLGHITDGQVTESQLGFDQLTPEERKDIITNDMDGNQVVKITCESCQQVLEADPERVLYPSLYH
ncbi:anti-sigma-F factor Fin [Laceyella putida]|uniref:Anti-sigma-F factor Fin n=1 Tax=Laceyella putida TaxID=110101 RepID=A0ABW2RQM0_9BACL